MYVRTQYSRDVPMLTVSVTLSQVFLLFVFRLVYHFLFMLEPSLLVNGLVTG